MYHYTAIVTCLALLFYFYTSMQVARARVKFGVKVPAITGSPDFERVFRVQLAATVLLFSAMVAIVWRMIHG